MENIKCGIFFFSKPGCKFCQKLEQDLIEEKTEYTKYTPTSEKESSKIKAQTGRNTYPILYIDKVLIGGYSDYLTLVISNQRACDF
jgi:glutaredoxin